MTRAEEFEELRPLLFSIAYRILGSVSEAEDAVQETWLRYEASPTQPTSTKAFLSAVVTRISIDVLRSARVRREEYVGQWFPEPLLDRPVRGSGAVGGAGRLGVDGGPAAARAAQPARAGGLRAAGGVRVRLPRGRRGGGPVGGGVPPARGPGAPPHGRRAAPVRGGPAGARGAGRRGSSTRSGTATSTGCGSCSPPTSQMVGDGGGKAPAVGQGVVGADNVARVLAAIFPLFARIDATVEPHEVNGQPGAIFRDRDGKVRQHLDARRARRADPDDPLGDQPRQARAPGSGGGRLGGRPRGEPLASRVTTSLGDRLRTRPSSGWIQHCHRARGCSQPEAVDT